MVKKYSFDFGNEQKNSVGTLSPFNDATANTH